MHIGIYVAIAENGVIGRDGGLPWQLSTDLKRFKATTMGKPVIAGRKTWESFPKRPLPGRPNIVVSRKADYAAEGGEVVTSLEEALALAAQKLQTLPELDEVCVIGGGEIYRQALPRADRLYVTHVLTEVDGDTRFPVIDPDVWEIVSSEDFPAGEKDSHATRYVVYQRREA
jgi:dihydrofolate reductase